MECDNCLVSALIQQVSDKIIYGRSEEIHGEKRTDRRSCFHEYVHGL